MAAGNTTFYIVAFIIIAHFIVGFIFLVRKLSGPGEGNSARRRYALPGKKSEMGSGKAEACPARMRRVYPDEERRRGGSEPGSDDTGLPG